MKKKIIWYLGIIIFVICIMFMNKSYAEDTQTLKGFLFENFDHMLVNEDSENLYRSSPGAQNADYKKDDEDGDTNYEKGIRVSWLHALESMRQYIVCDKKVHYYDIAASEDANIIKKAMKAVSQAREELDKIDIDVFKNITKYDDRVSYGKAVQELYKEVTAAYYFASGEGRNGMPNITDSYATKFKYTKKQWEDYVAAFGDRYNLSGEQRDTIVKVHKIKYAAKDDSTMAIRKDLYINKNDSYETMMGYDEDKINLYISLWGKNPCPGGSNENGPKDGVMIEWSYVLEHNGEHTPFFNRNFNGKDGFHRPENKDYYDTKDYEDYIGKYAKGETGLTKAKTLDMATDEDLKNQDEATSTMSQDNGNKSEDKEDRANSGLYNIPDRTSTTGGTNLDDVIEGADDFLSVGKDEQVKIEGLQDFSSSLYNILLTVGIIVAVIIGLIIGIKFMLGSVEAKAEVKKLLVPYIVGCVVVFGAFGIWKIVVVILGQL